MSSSAIYHWGTEGYFTGWIVADTSYDLNDFEWIYTLYDSQSPQASYNYFMPSFKVSGVYDEWFSCGIRDHYIIRVYEMSESNCDRITAFAHKDYLEKLMVAIFRDTVLS